jgi:hypothetical protein
LNIYLPTVRKHLHSESELVYERQVQPELKLDEFKARLTDWLKADAKLPKNQRRAIQRLFEGLVDSGFQGAYDSTQRFV